MLDETKRKKMKPLINKNLITLKCVLFFFLAGVGCIYPFLPLHMLSVGLDRGEARLISAVAPCIALLGPAILGPLVDRLSVGRGSTGGSTGSSGSGRLLRVVTAACLILSAIFYTLLLAVPYTERHEARRPKVLFMCDSEGAYVMQEVCTEGMRCNRWEGVKTGVLAVTACEYGCADDNMTWANQPFTTSSTTSTLRPMYNSVVNATPASTQVPEETEDEEDFEIYPPHLCSDGQCLVYMQHAGRLRVPLSLRAPEPTDNSTDDNWCTYSTGGSLKCPVPAERLPEMAAGAAGGCAAALRCAVLDPYDEPGGVLADAECRLVLGDPAYTFWTYFLIRVLADIWPTSALALLGAACVIATRETSAGRGDVGRQVAGGTLGLALLPPLAALAAAAAPHHPYLGPFLMHALCMLIAALILLFDKHMPLSTPEWWWHTAAGALALPMSAVRRYGAETAALCALLSLLGALSAAIDSYLPWCVVDLELAAGVSVADTWMSVALTVTAGALPAVLALWWAEALVDYVGHSNIFITAFIFYCLRFTGLAYATTYAWIVVCEVLEVFTMSLVWVTAILYFRHLVPRKYTTTGQALPVIAHFCIGRCIGAIVGGLVSLEAGEGRFAWRALGAAALLAAALYLALYHLLLAPRCAAPPAPPPHQLLQGLNANGASDGNYSPIRVYHEERSRKGHFRY